MQFRTEIELKKNILLSNKSKAITIGSCFSDVIGQRLLDNKLSCNVNPFGTVFNPISIFKLLTDSILQREVLFSHFVRQEHIYLHHDYHSRFWANSKEELKTTIEQTHQEVGEYLKTCNVLIITFGTALVYELLADKEIISNCHKVPSPSFHRRMLQQNEITNSFSKVYEQLIIQNPNLKIILTVSPVRHTKDTLQLNSVSKSILRATCFELETTYDEVYYFPSYEIMLDDLRDYRFYKADMIHPNEVAESYIFEKFAETFFADSLNKFMVEWEKIRAGLAHRPLQKGSVSHQKFLQNLLQKLEKLSHLVDVTAEKEMVKSELDSNINNVS